MRNNSYSHSELKSLNSVSRYVRFLYFRNLRNKRKQLNNQSAPSISDHVIFFSALIGYRVLKETVHLRKIRIFLISFKYDFGLN